MSIKQVIQKTSYLSSCGTKRINSLSEAQRAQRRPHVVIHFVCRWSSRSCSESRDLFWKSCCCSAAREPPCLQMVWLAPWDSRSRRYGKNRGWSTRTRCENHGCVGHQGAISITSPSWVVLASEWLCWAGEMVETCTSTSPASLVTEHLSPALKAPELET